MKTKTKGITKSFRFTEKTRNELKSLAAIWGVTETSALETMIDTFYSVRVDVKVGDKNGKT